MVVVWNAAHTAAVAAQSAGDVDRFTLPLATASRGLAPSPVRTLGLHSLRSLRNTSFAEVRHVSKGFPVISGQ